MTFKDCLDDIRKYCKDNFFINNPEYKTLKQLGKWTGNTPKYLYMYKENGKDLTIPIGLFSKIKSKFDLSMYKKQIKLADDKKIIFENDINLYDYQKVAVYEMIKKGYGILLAPTGSGKTQMGIALACKLGYKTLWITHTKDLLKQSYDRAKQYIDDKYLGTITDGKINIKDGITFSTIQTLSKLDLQSLKYEFNTVIVDECHRLAGTPTKLKQFSKVVNSIASRHKYGLTATLHRSDKLEETTIAYLGNIAYEVKREFVKDKIINPKIFKIDTGIELTDDCLSTDGTIDNNKLLTYLSQNTYRNLTICKYILNNKNNYNLILSHRIEQLENIYNMLPDEEKEKAVLLSSKLNKKAREKAIEDMKEGIKHYMFATYSLAKEGLDIQRLDRLYLASSSKDKAVVQQSVGRVMRVFENKDIPIVYDFVDDYIKANKDFIKRKGFYKNCGCDVNG